MEVSSVSQTAAATKHPLAMAVITVVASPIVEEFLYRKVLPDYLKRNRDQHDLPFSDRAIDQTITWGFAASHIGNPATPSGRANLAIPVSSLLGGEHYQSLARRRGLGYSILAHMIHNGLAVIEAVPNIQKARKSRQ